jgi:hypothetical protein
VKITYEPRTFKPETLAVVEQAEQICQEYQRQGYDLTLRQLYYQFVARGLIPNSQQSYSRLGDIVSNGRMAGLIDWSHIVDRTRNLRGTSHWGSPSDIIDASASSFRLDKWADQDTRVEVWVEKEALAGVVQRAADEYDVNWFSCRGYVSQSELWAAGRRHRLYMQRGQGVIVLHLGDHDPSGIDMTRDIRDRLHTFIGHRAHLDLEVRRIALNMDQVQQYNPPPNPTKLTDSRSEGYIQEYGHESWELDALDPATLGALIAQHIGGIVDDGRYQATAAEEARHRRLLDAASDRWDEIVTMLDGGED